MSAGTRSPRRPRTGRAWLAVALATLALAGASCAPHIVQIPDLTPAAREGRYRDQLAARATRGAAVDAQVVLWARGGGDTRLPSAEGRLLLAAPDAFRLRVGSIIGTALDLGARGDSISAYVPARRQALTLDAERDTLGLLRPGGLGYRAMSATWTPPAAAWSGATWSDSFMVVHWMEDEDTLAVAVGSDGLPRWASFTRDGGGGVRVTYRAWDRSSGAAWPTLLEIVDLKGPFSLTCKVSLVRFAERADPARLVVPIPHTAERMTLAMLRRTLERLGVM